MTMQDPKGLKGGAKQLWIKANQSFILEYCKRFGPEDTCERFGIGRQVLDELIKDSDQQREFDRIDRIEMLAKMAMDSARESKHKINILEKQYGDFTTTVSDQIARNFLAPLLRSAIRIPERLEALQGNNPLAMKDFDSEANKLPDGCRRSECEHR